MADDVPNAKTARAKTLLCRCEDVTLADLLHALDLGYRRMEEVKRYTGLGTGPCEGKECMAMCARVLAEQTGHGGSSTVEPFTARPPIAPVSLAALAALAEAGEHSDDSHGDDSHGDGDRSSDDGRGGDAHG